MKPLIVTTAHRGVFFGYGEPTAQSSIVLQQARMCVYWSADVHGVVGLAANGPTSTCRITPAVPSLTLRDITSVMEVSEKSTQQWEKAPWSTK